MFFLFPNRMSFLKLIIIEDEMERIVMREDAEKHCEPWRMTTFSSVFFWEDCLLFSDGFLSSPRQHSLRHFAY